MHILTTPEQMQAFDAAAARRFAIPGTVLMENAGRGVVDRIIAATGPVAGKHVTVVSGKGNNGGDGFVIARHLLLRGARVDLILLAPFARVSGDAGRHLAILRRFVRASSGSLRLMSQPKRFVPPSDPTPAIIVDALFGTGFTGAPREPTASAIRWINATGAFVVAVDLPSGLDGGSGVAEGEAVHADLTVTMAAEKVGQYIGVGPDLCGRIEVVDIGITPAFHGITHARVFRHDDASVARALPTRARTVHKYSAGKVLVIGGSRQYTGAPTYAARAALRTGAGAVVLAVAAGVRHAIASRGGDVLLQALPETPDGTIAYAALEELKERIGWADAVVLGPGLGRHAETDDLVRAVFMECPAALLVDADGLTALSGIPAGRWRRQSPTILTPHSGELARMLGSHAASVDGDRLNIALTSARRFHSVVVLKGASTVCASPDGTAIVNTTGNPGMATIGTGDVLAGMIAGLVSQGMSSNDAAAAGVYLHGRAGDLAAHRYGERSVLASDLLELIPAALLTVERE